MLYPSRYPARPEPLTPGPGLPGSGELSPTGHTPGGLSPGPFAGRCLKGHGTVECLRPALKNRIKKETKTFPLVLASCFSIKPVRETSVLCQFILKEPVQQLRTVSLGKWLPSGAGTSQDSCPVLRGWCPSQALSLLAQHLSPGASGPQQVPWPCTAAGPPWPGSPTAQQEGKLQGGRTLLAPLQSSSNKLTPLFTV